MQLNRALDHPHLILGLVTADGVVIGPSPAPLRAEVDRVAATRSVVPETTRTAIRDMLRHTGFKPSGRSKPASEYLAGAVVRDGLLPAISNVVDINNLVSLESGLPISVVDRGRLGDTLEVRVGRPEEKFVFARGADFEQTIEVEGLIVLARPGGAAVGSPVKDGVEAKLAPDTTRIAAVLYGNNKVVDRAAMERWCGRFAQLLRDHVRPESIATAIA
jgi:DNA/RNA-binding domain of Phe-tRNA-synthetase-like protein